MFKCMIQSCFYYQAPLTQSAVCQPTFALHAPPPHFTEQWQQQQVINPQSEMESFPDITQAIIMVSKFSFSGHNCSKKISENSRKKCSQCNDGDLSLEASHVNPSVPAHCVVCVTCNHHGHLNHTWEFLLPIMCLQILSYLF